MESPGSVDDYIPAFYVGQHESDRERPVTDGLVRRAHECNYDMLTAPITTSHFRDRVLSLFEDNDADVSPVVSPLTKEDSNLAPGELTSQLLAMASPWIDLSSPDPLVYSVSRQVLNLEIAFASFCGVANVIIPGPKLHHGNVHGDGVAQYAYTIQEILEIGLYHQVHIRLSMSDDPAVDRLEQIKTLSMYARPEFEGQGRERHKTRSDAFGTWDAWNVVRSICKYNARLFVALDVPRLLPPQSTISRWFSEPSRLLILSEHTFVDDARNKPVLFKPHQALITKFMRGRNPPWILLNDVGPIPMTDSSLQDGVTSDAFPSLYEASKQPAHRNQTSKNQDPTPHLNYIRWLQGEQPRRTLLEKFGAGYQDYLQAPLQPLTDNLESVTYEVFEKDPIKYDKYEDAIERALRDWSSRGKVASGYRGRIVVAVVGAGRGPIVSRALRASERAQVDIELWAIEKNPNACVLLERHNENEWRNQVNLVRSDMRSWKGPLRKATSSDEPGHPTTELPGIYTPVIDIVVSELLGSFADNELSPECLDGILPILNPSYGISIPHSYTSFLTPIAAPKLYADISARTATDPTAPHTPYVVMLHSIDYLSTTSPPSPSFSDSFTSALEPCPNIQKVWSFVHGPSTFPAPSTNSHNTRQARLTFRTRDRGVCHGLAGYFETVLYPGTDANSTVELSTNPLNMEQKSAGMMSWFPIFFPLKTPMYLPDHAEVTVTIRRCTDERKVWYEWVVESWGWNLRIEGEKQRIRLGVSEVGCSKAGGCMM